MIEHESRVKKYSPQQESHQELPAEHEDVFITFLHSVIHFSVRLMVALILWGGADVVLVLYQRLMAPPFMLLKIDYAAENR